MIKLKLTDNALNHLENIVKENVVTWDNSEGKKNAR